MAMRRPFTREQRTTIVYGMLCFVLILVDAAALAADRDDERLPRRRRLGRLAGAGASLACLLLNVGLLRYL